MSVSRILVVPLVFCGNQMIGVGGGMGERITVSFQFKKIPLVLLYMSKCQ